MFGGTNGKTFDAIIIVIFDYFTCFFSVAQIVLIEDDYFLFLCSFYDEIKLWITTAVWYSGISDL